MLLKKLETRGFKSFADKLTIEFGRGITAIVGPNGSGKSNITDAIRWVLGEQNMRTLRGAKSEDIIFSGTAEGRRPLGMAEVSVTIDNSDRRIPLDYSEIEIMRRVYRSGENEYYLNRNSCRLKDIQELLFGTGMGKNNLSVIGQNKVDEILGSKPEERRLIFEEAAGIAKYKQRKKESLRKLDDTNQNLLRIEDVTAEIETQLPAMKRKAENTTRYRKLVEERTQIQETLLLDKIRESEEVSRKTMTERETVRVATDDLTAEMAIFDAKQAQLKEAANSQEETIGKMIESLDRCRSEAEQMAGQVAILTERIGQNHTRMALFREELTRLDEERQIAEKQIDLLHSEAEGLYDKRGSIQAQYEACGQEQDAIDQEIGKQTGEIETVQREIFSLRQQLGIAEEKMRHQAESARTFETWQSRYQEALGEVEAALQSADHEIACLTEEERTQQALHQELSGLAKTTNVELSQVNEEIHTLKAQQLESEKQYHALHSRYTVLTSMQKEYEGFSRAGREILSRKQIWKDGVFGAVAELIRMNDDVVIAIETALGASLQNIVVDTETTAQKIIGYLKEHRLGRATFLPLSGLQVYPPRPQEKDAAREVGAVGIASELVTCEAKYRAVVEFLLNRTVIVRTLDDAVRIARKYRFKVRLITLDGDILNSGGSMTGGSRMRKEAGFLSRSIEIDSLRKQETDCIEKRSEQQMRLQEMSEEQERLKREQTEQAERLQAWQKRANELHIALEKARFTKTKLTETIKERQEERRQREELYQNSEAFSGRIQAECADWQERLRVAEMQYDEITARLREIQQTRKEKEQENIDRQVALSSLGEREQFIQQEKARLSGEITKHHLRCEKIRQELSELEKITAQQTQEKEKCAVEQKNKQDELARLTAEKELRQKERFTLLRELQDAEQVEKAYRKRAKELQDVLHHIEMQYAKQQYEHSRNQEALAELGLESFDELQEKVRTYEDRLEGIELVPTLRKIERAIQSLGPVNPTAVEEYQEMEERYAFLTKQQTDLIEAKTYLTDVIAQIDRVMEKNFAEAFHAIDGYFRTIFARIFGGGQARLELTNRGDMLMTGIEIIAQPPGKKQQNMVLLSGGERALTVIALLFAFLEYRPMPFAVVDEIDAPLDEANLERFVAFLKEFSERTQFIIITHRKVTMRAADVMHGVTNEDAGVSKVISVKMEEID